MNSNIDDAIEEVEGLRTRRANMIINSTLKHDDYIKETGVIFGLNLAIDIMKHVESSGDNED